MIYIYDARYNIKTPTTYEKLEGITGSKKATLAPFKSKKQKLPRLDYCYLIDDKTSKQQLRIWYEKVEFENETWKDIDETYKISNYGRVKKIYKKYPKGKFMMPYPKKFYRGKLVTKIHGKELLIHQLVAKYFVENLNNYDHVCHKNGILHDNYHGNLEYCSKSKASRYGISAQNIDKPSIVAIDYETGEIIDYFKSCREAASSLYTNRQSVLDSLHGKIKKTMCGYVFKYEEEVI